MWKGQLARAAVAVAVGLLAALPVATGSGPAPRPALADGIDVDWEFPWGICVGGQPGCQP